MLYKFSAFIVGWLIGILMELAGCSIFTKEGINWKNIAIAFLLIILVNIIPYLRR